MANITAIVRDGKIELTNQNLYSTISFMFNTNEERDLFLEKIASNFINEE